MKGWHLPTYISNAGCLEAFDQAVKTYTQILGPVANPDPQLTSGGTVQCYTVYPSARPDLKVRKRHQHRNTYAIFCYTGLDIQYIVYK
jgi:hypothetical protein